MKLLLTGAQGFIGTHFAQSITTHEIVPFSFQNGDIDLLDLSGYDTVIHLAALVHQMNGASTEAYEQVNVIRTRTLAQNAKADGVKHFFFMSTVKVYGEENDFPYTETSPCNPQDDYGRSKLRAEQELQKLEDDTFIVSIIRTPIVYGVGVKANIKNLIHLVQTIPILPFGNTHNLRSMVYLGNLCALFQAILEQKQGGIFLATDNHPLSTAELIREISGVLNKKTYLIHLPLFRTLLKKFKPSFYQRLFGNLTVDNTFTKEKLSFQNPYTTTEGIKYMIQANTQ